jgi:cellobiose-specific phosphotransferase system component IIA
MDGLLADMHDIIGINERELKGTDGWTVYEKSRKKEADSALATLTGSITERSSAIELQHALDLYMSCSVSDPTIEEQMREKIAARRVAEDAAASKLRASTTQYTGQTEAVVAQFQAKVDDPYFAAVNGQKKSRRDDRILKAGDTRRWAMDALLVDYNKAVDLAEEEGYAASVEIATARAAHANLLAEEQARLANEKAISEAKEKSLVQAFDATVLHFFSPDRADGKTAYERTLESAAAAKKREEWAMFEQKFNKDGGEIAPPPNDGRAVGIFRKLPGNAQKKAMVVASSNELISPAYAAMIASRHPEEKRRRRRPEAEAAKKYSYSAETDPYQLLRMPESKKRRPKVDSPAQQLAKLHPLLEDRALKTPTSTSFSTDALADWDSTAGSSVFAGSDMPQIAPSTPMTDWQLAMAHPKTPPRDPFGRPPATPPGRHSALRRRVSGRRSGQGLTSGSPGNISQGEGSFLEGWTQFAAVQLDRGGGIPALGSSNPVRSIGSVSRGRTRVTTRDAREQLGGRQ